MERLTGIDANFLYMETAAAHMHTIKVAVLETPPGVASSLDDVRQAMRERLHLLPQFRRRAVQVPFGLHHPVWIEDPAFDIRQHVHAVDLPPSGGWREIEDAVAAIASRPLDRSRPLWELWLLRGLADGSTALVAKIHHALADGVAAAELLGAVMDEGDAVGGVAPQVDAWTPEPLPSRGRLVRDALRDHAPNVKHFPRLLARTARGLRDGARLRRGLPLSPPLPLLHAPRTSLNGALRPARGFAVVSLPLDDVRHVRECLGVKLNDVVLALVAGSLRRYLARRDELPERPLVAEVPTSTDPAGGPRRRVGNRVSNLFTSLCTDVADPVQRVLRIHDVTAAAKEINLALGPDLYREWTDYAPPRPLSGLMRLYSRLHLADRHVPAVNVIVSSVAGPRRPLRWAGGRLRHLFSVGPLIEGTAVNVTAWSYVDRLDVGVLTCPEHVATPREIADGLADALDELLAAANAASATERVA